MIIIKKIIVILKKIVSNIFLLFSLNIIINSFSVIIPINIYTIIYSSLLGIPGILSLYIFSIII